MNLFDVNVLIALSWPTHEFHRSATRWFEKNESSPWATCAVTQLGFIRISGQVAAFGAYARSSSEAIGALALVTAHQKHCYLAELPPPANCSELGKLVPPGKVTDAYLLHLAQINNATFVTFDRKLISLAGSSTRVEILMP